MARGNRWQSFADAFNATYQVGNTLQKAIKTGRIATKDYTDEEGNKLTGIALDRARTDDYAAIEEQFGDPSAAIKMRQDFETQQQNKLVTDLRERTQDERVRQEGRLKSQSMAAATALNKANAGLAGASARATDLATKIRAANKDNEIVATEAAMQRDTAQSKADANYYKSATYTDVLQNEGLQKIAEAKLSALMAEIDTAAKNTEEYRANAVAATLADAKRTANVAEVKLELTAMPEYQEQLQNELRTNAENARAALANAKTDANLATNETFQQNRFSRGLSDSSAAADIAASDATTAQRERAANEFISKWYENADPKNPASMAGLVEGLKQIDPIMGMKLERDYGEHELWQLTSDALVLKQKANNVINDGGYDALVKLLDDQNGDKLGIQLTRDEESGAISLVETDQQGNVVRTIASGDDEKAFNADLNTAMDPAKTLEYLVTLSEIKLRDAQALYNTNQAKAGKALTPEQNAYQTLFNPEASVYEKEISLALLLKDNPEAYERLQPLLEVSSTTLVDPNAAGTTSSPPNQTGLGSTAEVPSEPVQIDPDDARTGQVVLDSINSAGSLAGAQQTRTGQLLLQNPRFIDNAIRVLQIQIQNPSTRGSRGGGGVSIQARRQQLLAELQQLRDSLGN